MRRRVSKSEWAYAAGFLDGDGSIGLGRRNIHSQHGKRFTYHTWVAVANTNLTILRWFRRKFGGSISFYRARANSTRFKGRRKVWSWNIPTGKHEWFLEGVYPFLKGEKRRKAHWIIKFRKVVFPRGGRKRDLPAQQRIVEAYHSLGQ